MQSCVFHALPPADSFVGRTAELSLLDRHLLSPSSATRTLSLIGMGGAGKTALAAQFLKSLPAHPHRPDALFVWSFYVDQDPGAFLREICNFIAAQPIESTSSTSALYHLSELLASTNIRLLLVLDGLERVQLAQNDPRGAYGVLEDPLLRRALSRLTSGIGQTKLLITTRFTPTDLHTWNHRTHHPLDLGELDTPSALALLRRRGVNGSDDQFHSLLSEFGSHALTLDHLAGYLGHFQNGHPSAESLPPSPSITAQNLTEIRLTRVLSAYARDLPPVDLALLQRLCLYRFGAKPDTLFSTFARNESASVAGPLHLIERADFNLSLSRLREHHLISPEGDGTYTTHPAVRDFFYSLLTDTADLHTAAGRGMLDIHLDNALAYLRGRAHEYEIYSQPEVPIEDRQAFCEELQQFLDKKRSIIGPQIYAVFSKFLAAFSAGKRPSYPRLPNRSISLLNRPGKGYPQDKPTLDLLEELIHHTLQAGHPEDALRIYDERLGGRDHLAKSLGEYARGNRITAAFPALSTKWSSTQLDRAWYLRGLGELDHSIRLFQQARPLWAGTTMVLRGLLPDTLRDTRVWPHSRHAASILSGRQPPVFKKPELGWGEALVDGEVALLYNELTAAESLATEGLKYFKDRNSPEATRCRLVLADVYRRRSDLSKASHYLDEAEAWITRSGSVEHLILLLTTRMRLAHSQQNFTVADHAYTEAVHLAARCGFTLYHIDLLNLHAASLLDRTPADPTQAATLATAALNGLLADSESPASKTDLPFDSLLTLGALHPRCQYAWGQAAAYLILGRCMILAENFTLAHHYLQTAFSLQSTLGSRDLPLTAQLLNQLP